MFVQALALALALANGIAPQSHSPTLQVQDEQAATKYCRAYDAQTHQQLDCSAQFQTDNDCRAWVIGTVQKSWPDSQLGYEFNDIPC